METIQGEHSNIDTFNEKVQNLKKGFKSYELSGKLKSLLSLLYECGIVPQRNSQRENEHELVKFDGEELITEPVLYTGDEFNAHRALIFCQMKNFQKMVEEDVLVRYNIKYLKLDSSLNPKQRFEVAEKFNSHPQYKVLLLSTHIGSLGLNLTGADTVIFMEHDWNPMKDLQAIDRAHRIGQTKVVTVYRLISIGTLEAEIMNLQRFKKKLHKMLIHEKQATGAEGDEEGKVEVSSILKSFENQDAFKNELDKNISSASGIQVKEDDISDNECENFLSKVDKKWLNLDD